VLTRDLGKYLKDLPESLVILETSAETFAVADVARDLGHRVNVVPATLVKTLGVGSRGVKNDRRDAQILSEVSCRIALPSVHVPSLQSRERKQQCGMREALVEQRTSLVNTVRGWMRTELIRVRPGTPRTFPDRVRSAAVEREGGLPAAVERVLQVIDLLTEQIRAADKELEALAKQDPLCQRLMTVPGIGPTTAVRFAAAVDDVSRFRNAHVLQSYLGLTPGEDSSGERQRRTRITKAGSVHVRWALTMASHAARFHYPNDPMVLWSKNIERRSNKLIATTALARKLAGVLYAIWRDGTSYLPRPANTDTPMAAH
jgi:transposase